MLYVELPTHFNWSLELKFTYPFTVKFRKIAPGLIFFKDPFCGAYIRRGLCMEGNLLFKIDIRRDDLKESFFCVTILGGLYLEGLIFGILRYLGKFMTKSTKLNLHSEFNLTIIDPCKILRLA